LDERGERGCGRGVYGCVSRIILEDIGPLEIISSITNFEAESSLTYKWIRRTRMSEKGTGRFAQIRRSHRNSVPAQRWIDKKSLLAFEAALHEISCD